MGFFASREAETPSLPVSHDKVGSAALPSKSVAQLLRIRLNGGKRRVSNLGPLHSTDYALSVESTSDIPAHGQVHSNCDYGTGARSHLTHVDSLRSSTDIATTTLAHKLNELAVANADGLLNDDDYRVLRQDLFTSFVAVSAPPTEPPIVKSVEPVPLRLSSESRGDCPTKNTARAPSLRTNTSNGSSISTLFQRVLRRTSENRDMREQDQVSIASSLRQAPFSPSMVSVRGLSRQASNSSLKSDRSRTMTSDLLSVSSRRSMKSTGTNSNVEGMSRRSTRSLRGCMPPPSSFNARHLTSSLSSDRNEGRLRSAEDIRAEICATEAEERSVLAAMSLLVQQPFNPTSPSHVQVSNSWPTVSGQSLSASQIPHQSPAGTGLFNTPRGTIPTGLGQGHDGSTIHDQLRCGVEMRNNEIERRKAEIAIRYHQRLDYLRARLKGAEIHERLLRK